MSQSQGGRVAGSHVQLQSRMNGVRNNIQAIGEMAEEAMRACTVAALDLEDAGDSERVQEVDSALRSLIDTRRRLEAQRDVALRVATQAEGVEDVEGLYAEQWGAAEANLAGLSEAERYGGSSEYREFRQQIWDLRHEGEAMPPLFGGDSAADDEDLVIEGARMSYRCPVSGAWLQDPVTSKACGHSFSREAILDYVRGAGGSCACPVDGCASRVSPQALYADRVLERRVARHLRQREAEETAAQYTLVQ